MSEKAKAAVEIFGKHVGTSDGYSEWIEVDQKRINLFADATLDHQFIHIDPETLCEAVAVQGDDRARLPDAVADSASDQQHRAARRARIRRTRDGRELRPRQSALPRTREGQLEVARGATLLEADLKAPNTIQLKQQVTIEIEGSTKPACVAEFLMRLIYS